MTPECSCHDAPMRWIIDGRYTAGGYWRCLVRERERNARNNERRFYVGDTYLGMSGFTQTEREALLNGTSD